MLTVKTHATDLTNSKTISCIIHKRARRPQALQPLYVNDTTPQVLFWVDLLIRRNAYQHQSRAIPIDGIVRLCLKNVRYLPTRSSGF
jgi:hypothetical protein